jgi:hypothetical protein
MRSALVFALCVAAAVSAANPPNPTISSTFTSGVSITSVQWELTAPGQFLGFMATDAVAQNTFMAANETVFDVGILKLYKNVGQTPIQFQYIPQQQNCEASKLTDQYFAWFSWLPAAQYQGENIVLEQIVDTWGFNSSDGHMLILYAVGNTPIRFVTAGPITGMAMSQTIIIDFFQFSGVQPNESYFDIPAYCVQSDMADANVAKSVLSTLADKRRATLHHMTQSIANSLAACAADM